MDYYSVINIRRYISKQTRKYSIKHYKFHRDGH